MTSQSQGIQQLLQAEKRAKDKLEEAKKSKYLKEHEKIQAEIQLSINLKYCIFFLWCELRGRGNLSTKIEEQTTEKIRDITNSFHKYMENIMKQLLNMVYDIKPEIHPNYRDAV
uniref:V-type proton ATPase subunit G n=1 Tax=Terrapene triunguis TaxID=2587831 RepID=A0A674J0Q0_9SAUR